MNAAAIPIDVFNAVVDYLQKQPYKDVNQLIDALREQTKTVELKEETPSNDEE
jgi:translation initiation factor 2B subunit (eIF-2B alpha/beta/delta family)